MSSVQLRVSIEIGSDPIEGEIRNGQLEPQPFFGWVELAAAIEAARAAHAAEPGVDDKKD